MFGSILTAVLAHKQIVIAAIAISGLVMYAFPYSMLAANAQPRGVNIQRNIEIPCLPYCNVGGPGGGPPGGVHIHRVVGPPGNEFPIDIDLSFVQVLRR